jgi:Protein of unknown function (DUF3505).
LGLIVNTELSNLCCEACRCTCYAEHVSTHLKNKHPDAHITLNMETLNSICKKMQVQSKMPLMLPGIRDEFDGIRVQDGISCTHYEFACRSDQYMEEHHRKTHPWYTASAKWPKVKVQQLNQGSGTACCYFQIKQRNTPEITTDDATVSQLSGEIHFLDEQDEEQAEEINAWMVSPWLLSTKWHEHVSGYNVAELKAQVTPPKPDEFPDLTNCIMHLLLDGEEIIDEVPELVLQRLNSPYPDQE